MKKIIRKHIQVLTAGVLVIMLLCSCGAKEELSVEDEVDRILTENIAKEPIPADDNEISSVNTAGIISGTDGKGASKNDPANDKEKVSSAPHASAGNTAKPSAGEKDTPGKCINPFLGSTSTATSFYMRFNIETDSGVAGITWGSMDGTDGEYYLFAFDCTRDIPMLYTSRRQGETVYDETYTNLDFMYPEMIMFTSVEHIVEIVVSQNTATTYLDKYMVCETALNSPKPVGQFGTWVMDGDYHEYIDNLFVAEGVDGEGEWIYSDDFARKDNLFAPALKTVSGRLYATTGYHVAPKKEN